MQNSSRTMICNAWTAICSWWQAMTQESNAQLAPLEFTWWSAKYCGCKPSSRGPSRSPRLFPEASLVFPAPRLTPRSLRLLDAHKLARLHCHPWVDSHRRYRDYPRIAQCLERQHQAAPETTRQLSAKGDCRKGRCIRFQLPYVAASHERPHC